MNPATIKENNTIFGNHTALMNNAHSSRGRHDQTTTTSTTTATTKSISSSSLPLGINFGQMSLARLIFVGIITVAGFILLVAVLVSALHTVKEGDVGIYYRYGAILEDVTEPGIHWSQPFVTTVVGVTVRPEAVKMQEVECITADGIVNMFKEIEVISLVSPIKSVRDLIITFGTEFKRILVYDRITEAIQQFCARYPMDDVYNVRFLELEESVGFMLTERLETLANGSIQVINLHIPKPEIPAAIFKKYRDVKTEWTRNRVAEAKKITKRIAAETDQQLAVIAANRTKLVMAINMTRERESREMAHTVTEVRNDIFWRREVTLAEAAKYTDLSEAESNLGLLSNNYVRLGMAVAMANNSELYLSHGEESKSAASLIDGFLNMHSADKND